MYENNGDKNLNNWESKKINKSPLTSRELTLRWNSSQHLSRCGSIVAAADIEILTLQLTVVARGIATAELMVGCCLCWQTVHQKQLWQSCYSARLLATRLQQLCTLSTSPLFSHYHSWPMQKCQLWTSAQLQVAHLETVFALETDIGSLVLEWKQQ